MSARRAQSRPWVRARSAVLSAPARIVAGVNSDEASAAKMRQAINRAGIMVTESSLALAAVVFETAPWSDERAVARALRSWANAHWSDGALEPRTADGAGQVAEHMRLLGTLEPPTPSRMIG